MISSSSRTSKLRTSSGDGASNGGASAGNTGGSGEGGGPQAGDASTPVKKLKTTSLRPGGLGLGKGLRKRGSALRAKAKGKRNRGGPNLKDQTGPRKLYSVHALLQRREEFQGVFPSDLPRIIGVTGLGLGLQDDLTAESWEETESSRPTASSSSSSTPPIKRGGGSGAAPTPAGAGAGAGADGKSSSANIFGEGQQRKSDQPGLGASDQKRKGAKGDQKKSKKATAAAANSNDDTTTTDAASASAESSKKEVDTASASADAKPSPTGETSEALPPATASADGGDDTAAPAEPAAPSKAWVPRSRAKLSPLESVKAKVKSILNKITAANFATLSDQLVTWSQDNVSDAEQLGMLVSLVYQYATGDQNFVRLYAGLCTRLSKQLPTFEDPNNDKQDATFRYYLLTKCQIEFQNAVEVPSAEQKKKMIGNINFIGELYKVDLLSEVIMHKCIQHLVREGRQPSEDDSEQLCNLVTRIGKKLDSGKNPKYLKAIDGYFERFARLSKSDQQTARSKFLFLDLIDLRKNKWVPNRERKGVRDVDPNAKKEEEEGKIRNPSSEPLTRDFPSSSALGGGAYKGSSQHGNDLMIHGSVDRYTRRKTSKPTEAAATDSQTPSDNNKPRAAQSFGLLPSKARPVRTRSPRGAKKPSTSSAATPSKGKKTAVVPRGDGKARPKLIPEICEALFAEESDIAAAEKKFRKFGREKDKEECVNKLFNLSLDKDDNARAFLATFLARLVPPVAKPCLDNAVVLKVLNNNFDADEYDMLCLDYPKLSQYYGDVVAHLLLKGVVGYDVLPSLVGELRKVEGRTYHDEKFLGHTLNVLHRVDADAAKAALASASINIGSMLRDSSKLGDFLSENKLNSFS